MQCDVKFINVSLNLKVLKSTIDFCCRSEESWGRVLLQKALLENGRMQIKDERKVQKVDCCSNGGEAGGWSAKRKDRTRCEPCKTTVVGIQQNSFVSFYTGLETQIDY